MEKKDPTNGKAPGLQSEDFEKNSTNIRKFSGKSNATEAQYERIDGLYDRPGKLISTLDFRKMGVIHPSGRIKEMNEKMGYYIPRVDCKHTANTG